MFVEKPRIVISKCLEFDSCRYDGRTIQNEYIHKLKNFIEFIPVCPEVEIGMGTPRDTIKLIKTNKKSLLFQPKTGKNFKKEMDDFSKKFLNKTIQIDGFILKSKSPSCGVKNTKIYSNILNEDKYKNGNGVFAENILNKFSKYPIRNENELDDSSLRKHFYTSIFTIAEFRTINNINKLYEFHRKHKYLFMSYNQLLMKEMGDIAANRNNKNIARVLKNYKKSLITIFSEKPNRKSNINTYMHIMGYFKNLLEAEEKECFLKLLKEYKAKKVPLLSINNIVTSWIIKFDNTYLKGQSLFCPFPNELIT